MESRLTLRLMTASVVLFGICGTARAQDDVRLREDVMRSIRLGTDYLLRAQKADGSWGGMGMYPTGQTSLALLALINCGMTPSDKPIERGLRWLRKVPEPQPSKTYEVSLMISAMVAAKDGVRDHARIHALASRLEGGQLKRGNAGSWSYDVGNGRARLGGGDRSNAQFGVLGLRDAAMIGYKVDRETWLRARTHWKDGQSNNGGWGYGGRGGASGSMTCAGIATLAITARMLRDDSDLKRDGTVDCCQRPLEDRQLERAIDWMARNFAVNHNPRTRTWVLYYLYALERAGRLTGQRFFGRHDWYREGARHLVDKQKKVTGEWGNGNERGVVGTSLALLFLSKGLARVVINKLEYGPPDPNQPGEVDGRDWENHPEDIRNLVEHISGLKGWPRLLTHQTVNVYRLNEETAVAELAQAPIAFISGAQRPAFTDLQVGQLRAYVDQGGFILACATCREAQFDDGFRDLLKRMFPEGDAELKRLGADHPVFRAEYDLDADAVELHGVDFGCRTPIIYSPVDLACYWDRWMKNPPDDRPDALRVRVKRDVRTGVNIVAYATGREPPVKLHDTGIKKHGGQERIERGLLQIAKLKHAGGWDTAPRALRNLLMALNETVGVAASTKPKAIPAVSEDIFNYPLIYMHGRNAFRFNPQEREQVKEYLSRGHVLFADACCGAEQFDRSFRSLMREMFPDQELKRIAADHPLFTKETGHDIRSVERRVPLRAGDVGLRSRTEKGEPFLEGIEIDGRLAVIYSKYDISCALERQSTAACKGYIEKDAVRIAVNVVLYSMLQDVNGWRDYVLPE